MKYIVYTATYQTSSGQVMTDRMGENARNINSGFVKAARRATKNLPAGWEIVSVEFTEVR